jgi:SnoaL-like domain
MSTPAVATRRRFFLRAGAALSAPLAVSTSLASNSGADGVEVLQARLAALEDVDAIRELQRTFASLVNARAHDEIAKLYADPAKARIDENVRGLSADDFGERDVVELEPGGNAAAAQFHCVVRTETPIGPTCTLVEMARQQGDGVIRRSERSILEVRYVKRQGLWKIERSAYRRA